MNKKEIRIVVEETIAALRSEGLLKSADSYSRVRDLLRRAGKTGIMDSDLSSVLDEIKDDYYFEVLRMNYFGGMTLEQIAEVYDKDVTTIARNKRRLCKYIAERMGL